MIPQLRFPEFTDEWQVKKLGDIAVFFDGKRVPIESAQRQTMSGEYPYYGASGIIDYVNDYIFDGEYVLLAEDGANIIMRSSPVAFIAKGKFWLNNHAHIMKAHGSNVFLATYLEMLRYDNYNTGTTQPKLNAAVVKKIKVATPSKPEQEKIADFLTAVNERIAVGEKKLELLETYKRGVMQKIFSQQVRFKDDNGNPYPDWEEKKLKSLLVKNKKRNKNLEINYVQSVSNARGFVSQNDYFDGANIASKNTSNYFIIEKSTFAYNPSRINVGSLAYKSDETTSIVSPLYVSFKTQAGLLDAFLLPWFSTELFKKQMNRSFEGSVRDTLSFEALSDMRLMLPNEQEQQKIADFLTTLDDKITAEKSKLTAAKQFKKALLQRMFV